MNNSALLKIDEASLLLSQSDEAVLSPGEAARILGLSDETVRKKVHTGEIKGYVFPGKGIQGKAVKYILIPIGSLKTYLKATVTPEALRLLNEV
jgi:excisionase family DNA binding protein